MRLILLLLITSTAFAGIEERPADPVILEMLKEYKPNSACEIVIDMIVENITKLAVDRAISESNEHRTNIDVTSAAIKKFRKFKIQECKNK